VIILGYTVTTQPLRQECTITQVNSSCRNSNYRQYFLSPDSKWTTSLL